MHEIYLGARCLTAINHSINKSNSHDSESESEDKHQYSQLNFILINDFDSVKWVLETVVRGEVYSIQHYVITFVSALRQVCGFLRYSGFLHQ